MTLKHVALRLIAGLVSLLLMLPGAIPVRALSSTSPEPSRESHIPPAPTSNVLRFERISLEQGLSQSAVLTIYQDRQGYIWMGTEGGLNRFDGYQFTVFKHDAEDSRSLTDDYVSSIYEDRQGKLWVGTRSGLEELDRTTGEFIHWVPNPEDTRSLSGKWVTAITEDREGTLWIGTDDGGLNRFDAKARTFQHYRHDILNSQTIAHDSIRAIVEDRDGSLWVGTRAGLDRLDPKTGVFVHAQLDASPASGREIAALYQDKQGILWIGTETSGLYRWDPVGQITTRFRHNENDIKSLSHDRVRAVLEDHEGRLWVGTQNGLDRLDPTRNEFIHYRHDASDPHSLSADTMWSIYEDRSGVLWFGTYSGGVNKYSDLNNRFALYRHNPYTNSLSDNMVWSLYQDNQGVLWIGTFNGGLNRQDPQTGAFSYYRFKANDPNGISSDDVRAILGDAGGNLWVGTSGGLDRFDRSSETFVHYRNNPSDPTSLGDNRVTVLLQDRQGNLWVGTRNGGINRLNPATGTFVRYQHSDADPFSLSDDRVWALYQDRAGALWVGTLGGVNVLDPETGRFKHYLHDTANPQSVNHNAAFAFYEDASGSMWIGTWGGGLDRFDRTSKTFGHLTEKDGLPDNVVYAIEPDARGRLWVSTNKGIAAFDPATRQIRTYDIRDGLQDNEFNAGAHFQNDQGQIFFGGTQGFNSFYPNQFQNNTTVPPIVITNFSKFSQSARKNLVSGEQIQLNYDDNFISFDFATLDYTAPGKNQYAFRMEGLDPTWVNAGTRRHADYPNLRPGSYVFRVKGANNDGVWNEQGVAIHITITPPFWETLWFRGLVGLLIAGVVFGVYRWRVRDLRARSLQLEKEVADRTAEVVSHAQRVAALEERNRLARELHDAVTQTMFAASLTADVLPRLMDRDPQQGRQQLEELRRLNRGALAEMRTLLLELRPAGLDSAQLPDLLRQLAQAAEGRAHAPVQVDISDVGPVPIPAKMALYRITQEALNNVIKHAEATAITVSLRRITQAAEGSGEVPALELIVGDNGCGFDPSRVPGGHMGAGIMRERALAIGAQLTIESAPAQGTRVRVVWKEGAMEPTTAPIHPSTQEGLV